MSPPWESGHTKKRYEASEGMARSRFVRTLYAMVPVVLIEVAAFIAATTGVIGAAVAVRRVLRGFALRRVVAEVPVPRAEPCRAPTVVAEPPSPRRRRVVR